MLIYMTKLYFTKENNHRKIKFDKITFFKFRHTFFADEELKFNFIDVLRLRIKKYKFIKNINETNPHFRIFQIKIKLYYLNVTTLNLEVQDFHQKNLINFFL